ncbi:hypothetical protein [Apibacter adventoris]|uniref:hypothetical protein n=1 Tax=Apibacter adventoris TaxID=1679466 RepID=UPI000CF6AB9C|nr:hypothetical protein [Apibacter adventoris]PQL95657.1 hypothetical protein C4S76_02040 [Apibacter adventoris]
MKKKLFLVSLLSSYNLIFSQIGIGTDKPDPSAILDINADQTSQKKGVLFPRVALTSSTDIVTIPKPTVGLIVFNTGENPGFTTRSFYYWDGTEWRLLDSSTAIEPSVNSLQCENAMLTPPRYIAGQKYSGTITLPYIMGNGGKYTNNGILEENGLSYGLQPGTLNFGNGTLSYTVTGSPSVSSPTGTKFTLKFLDKSCEVTLGTLNEIKTVNFARKNTSPIDIFTPENSVTKIGNLEVRYNGTDPTINGFIEFRPLIPTHVTLKYDKVGYGGQNLEIYGTIPASNDGTWYKTVTDGVWNWGWGVPSSTSGSFPDLSALNRDIGTVLITFQNNTTQEVYRVSVNINDAIPAYNRIPAIKSGVTFFIEKLE